MRGVLAVPFCALLALALATPASLPPGDAGGSGAASSSSSLATTGRPDLDGVVAALERAGGLSSGAAVASTLRAIARAEGHEVAALAGCPSMEASLALHFGRLGISAPVLPGGLPRDLSGVLGCLLGALHGANIAHDRTFAGLDVLELLRLAEAGAAGSARIDALVEGRDHAGILAAAIHVADAVALATPVLGRLEASGAPLPPLDLRPVLRFEPAGSQTFGHNYALIVDLEGDDVYDNHAGGVFAAVGTGIFYAEDAWAGAGSPGNPQAHVGGKTQDSDAVLSAGLVLDLAGSDQYGVKHPPRLQDLGCPGADRVPWVGTAGGGIIGVGMLFDEAGDNLFLGRTQTQGAGHVLGVGVLSTGPGRDTFDAVRAAQGSGLLGGVGLLLDHGGDDTYGLAMPAGGVWNGDLSLCDFDVRYAQGSSFDRRAGAGPSSVGILADLGGDDSYAGTQLVQGFGQGPGFGLLYEAGGDDSYAAADRAQGAAQGRSRDLNQQAIPAGGVGILLDRGGNDAYALGGSGQGWSLAHALGEPLPPPDLTALLLWARDRNEAVGLLLDEAGTDAYDGPAGRADGVTVDDGQIGLFVDRT